ncbi:MAG: hypothetical protein HY923_09745 [Elusimicrobia bacterium]|nr:hypothetical protein [Elusimicrobiota bacterium]
MLIPLLSLAVAVAAPAPAQTPPAVSAARLDQIERLSTNWQTYKAKSGRAWGKLYDLGNGQPDEAEWHGVFASLLDFTTSIEDQEQLIMAEALTYVRARTSDPALLASRENAIRLLRQVRMLRIYGDILPRALDESVLDAQGKPDGRRIAGSAWDQVLTDEEGQAACGRLKTQIGIPADEFEALQKRIGDKYRAEHPLPRRPGQR